MILSTRTLPGVFVFAFSWAAAPVQPARAQDSTSPAATESAAETKPEATQAPPDLLPPGKRVLGVLPNYRTVNDTGTFTPIDAKQKFVIGLKDSFDYPLFFLAAAFAGIGQLSDQNPSFGQGMAGFGRRLGTSYADQAIGNMMTEAIFPSLLHDDPRYFRLGQGSIKHRTWYALTRVLVTRRDSDGSKRFNYSEVLGNATGVAISNLYYPDDRSAANSLERTGEQIATDAISQVLKEFWPDIKHKFLQRHKE